MTSYKQHVIKYAVAHPDGRMPFRHGWTLLNTPEKKKCLADLKKIFGVETYESVRTRIAGNKRIKLTVAEAVRVGQYFFEEFNINNPWGDDGL